MPGPHPGGPSEVKKPLDVESTTDRRALPNVKNFTSVLLLGARQVDVKWPDNYYTTVPG